jgi:hypothetical protein
LRIKKENILEIILAILFVLSLITNWYRPIALASSLVVLIMVLDRLGKGIVLRELIALHSMFVCVLMPLVGYVFYDRTHHLALLWVKYMPVGEETYFAFSLPANVGFAMAICWPLTKNNESDGGEHLNKLIERARFKLKSMYNISFFIMLIGVVSFAFADFLPEIIQFVFTLLFFSAFAGFLYMHFIPSFKRKLFILILFALFIFVNAVQSGMFTIVAYMGLTMFSFFFIGKKTVLWKKGLVFLIGLIFVFFLQIVKLSFRQQTWRQEFEGSKTVLFFEVVRDQFENFSWENLSDAFFPIYARGNQGFNVCLVMRHIPNYQDFDGGKNLFINLLSSFVPRVFWPDKPKAGGKFNMAFYAGYNIEGWSTNVGPVGEAYGSFGVYGGIFYMVFLGVLIRWSYQVMMRLSRKIPLLLFWIPVIFYQVTYAAESDTLQILNSLIKAAFFVWLLYRFRPSLFGIVRTPITRLATKKVTSTGSQIPAVDFRADKV